jgi:uncharacterized protein (DUF2384 family)
LRRFGIASRLRALASLLLALERRRIAQRRFSKWDYSRVLRLAEWGSGVSLHGSNPELPMSALGQQRTSRHDRRQNLNW